MLTIGRLAGKAGVTRDTLRFYERVGLIVPGEKNSSGYRLYPEGVLPTLRFIKAAQRCGFSLAEIGRLVQGEASRAKSAHQLAVQKKQELAEAVAVMKAMVAALDVFIATAPYEAVPHRAGQSALVTAFCENGDAARRVRASR